MEKDITEQTQQSAAEQQKAIAALREAIETVIGRRIQTPKNFDLLSQMIEERCGEHVSVSTLKRVWGYVTSSSMPRRSTLNILAQLVGKRDWDDFCASAGLNLPDNVQQITPTQKDTKKRRNGKSIAAATVAVFAGFIVVLCLMYKNRTTPSSMILCAGQSFATHDEYLDLFGVEDRCEPWSVSIPNQPGLIIWGPEYNHPDWHNEGNADSLMPTITEYWQPADTTDLTHAVIALRNADNYLRAKSFAELRITFMKGLPGDSAFTFLGIYALDIVASDTTRLVWKRVTTECDLRHLDRLQQFRHSQ